MPHSTPVVDVHAHLFPSGLPDLAASTGDDRWPVLDRAGDEARVLVRGTAVRRAGRVLWDVPARVAALDAAGVDLQVVSPVPVALVPWAPAGPAAAWCAALNDGLAAAVAGSGGRLAGLGALPLGPGPDAVAAGIAEARRIRARGLVGAELQVGPTYYNDPVRYQEHLRATGRGHLADDLAERLSAATGATPVSWHAPEAAWTPERHAAWDRMIAAAADPA
jgi:predicted TIM-barrel fold metal-dependent hydrolase